MKKTKMAFLKKACLAVTVFLILLVSTAFVTKNSASKTNQVMIYGIVYMQKCNSEAYQAYSYRLVDQSNYYNDQKKLEASLRSDYPNAKRIYSGSSKHDYGSDASNMCVIKWQGESNNCNYSVLAISFGETQQEALNKAMKRKNDWAGQDSDYEIVIQKYW